MLSWRLNYEIRVWQKDLCRNTWLNRLVELLGFMFHLPVVKIQHPTEYQHSAPPTLTSSALRARGPSAVELFRVLRSCRDMFYVLSGRHVLNETRLELTPPDPSGNKRGFRAEGVKPQFRWVLDSGFFCGALTSWVYISFNPLTIGCKMSISQ